jgi:hypothetical protein
MRLPNGVRVLRDCLTGLGLLAGTGGFGRLGLSTVHTTVGGTRYSTIAARCTLPSNTLAGRLTGGTELGDFLTKLGNFGEQLVHLGGVGWELGRGRSHLGHRSQFPLCCGVGTHFLPIN